MTESSIDGSDNPLSAIVKAWLAKIKKGCEFKQKQFGDDARTCSQFFGSGNYSFMYGSDFRRKTGFGYSDTGDGGINYPEPSCQMTMNKVAEGVQIFGPVLYWKNPYRMVGPRKLPELPYGLLASDAKDQQQAQMLQQFEQSLQQVSAKSNAEDIGRASLLEWMLNWTPREFGLKREQRLAVDEAMITGMSTIWTESYQPKGFPSPLAGSFYDSGANLVLDPDPDRRTDCMWITRKCVKPVWEVEREYELEPGALKGDSESFNQQANMAADPDGDYKRKKGETNDLCTYWKIWSKMGVGARIKGVPEDYRAILEDFGDYAYLVVKEGCPFFLNLPPKVVNDPNGKDEAFKRLEWPTPYWLGDEWPVEIIALHDAPNQIYPMAHFKPVLGQLIFLNWMMSFVASKIRSTSRDFIAAKKSIGDEMVNKILHGPDLTFLPLDVTGGAGNINELISFLQHPSMNMDIWKVVDWMMDSFEKGSGLTELQYGVTTSQMRSAQEANIKSSAMNVRPDDMADRVEDSAARIAKREAMALRWHVKDVTPYMGPAANVYWQKLVAGTDPLKVFHGLEYTIEAGSTRKPNKERDAANVNQALQTFMPGITEKAAGTGDFGRYNEMVRLWGKAVDMDVEGLMEPPPPPPQNAGPSEGDLRAQEMQQDEQAHQMTMRHDSEKHKLDMKQQQEKAKAAKKIDAAKVAKAKKPATNGSAK